MVAASSLEVVTLVVAVFGAVTGAAALAVQVASHVVSGVRARAELRAAVLAGAGMVTLSPGRPAFALGLPHPRRAGFAISVRNTGRLSGMVSGIQLGAAGAWIRPFDGVIGPPLPYRLEASAEQTWFVPAEHLAGLFAAAKDDQLRTVEARVSLGDGRVLTAAPIGLREAMTQTRAILESD